MLLKSQVDTQPPALLSTFKSDHSICCEPRNNFQIVRDGPGGANLPEIKMPEKDLSASLSGKLSQKGSLMTWGGDKRVRLAR